MDVDDDIFDIVIPVVGMLVRNRELPRSPTRRQGGSVDGRSTVERNRESGHIAIQRDYFATNSTYNAAIFETRFRMPRSVFDRIFNEFERRGILAQGPDATGRQGLSTIQKMTAALRILAYGSSADAVDEYLRAGKSTILDDMKTFCAAVVTCFSSQYARRPTKTDLIRIYKSNAKLGFPGLIGSIDCTHFVWHRCPKALRGQYKGKEGVPTIILETVVTHDVWIWHSFFGTPGSCNDLNVLKQSSVLDDLLLSNKPVNNIIYKLNGSLKRRGYFLGDGIHPESPVFARPIKAPITPKEKRYTEMQEKRRKDVERAYGILKTKFGFLGKPFKLHKIGDIADAVNACLILHNMCIEAAGRAISPSAPPDDESVSAYSNPLLEMTMQMKSIYSKEEAASMKADLIEHVWKHHHANSD